MLTNAFVGTHSKIKENLLQQVPEARAPQGFAVQERSRLSAQTGQAPLRLQAEGLRWTDQANLQKEGEADQEDHNQIRVHQMQETSSPGLEEMQIIRHGKEGHLQQGRSYILSTLYMHGTRSKSTVELVQEQVPSLERVFSRNIW